MQRPIDKPFLLNDEERIYIKRPNGRCLDKLGECRPGSRLVYCMFDWPFYSSSFLKYTMM